MVMGGSRGKLKRADYSTEGLRALPETLGIFELAHNEKIAQCRRGQRLGSRLNRAKEWGFARL